ncbi:18341_t:CDS:2 [Racocetra fulgida]|uniref:18341_t:CDS:1 n=1 Tax=Racocetra fulgida TaxID=60492 RepID=A0A9N8Z048_9GLOM|nr:18341_t:CDS:2 [Racocetra fulgida]
MGIVGRIYIATEGINAQLSCPVEQLDELRKFCDQELKLENLEFNFSTIHVKAFRKLNVKIRNQVCIVSDGLEKGSYDLSNQPKHLSPEEWHTALSNAKTPIILIDMRNHYESEFCLRLVKAWDEKFGRPSGFDDVKPGYQCVYDHVHRTRPKLVIERLGGASANVPSDLVEMLLEKNSNIKN